MRVRLIDSAVRGGGVEFGVTQYLVQDLPLFIAEEGTQGINSAAEIFIQQANHLGCIRAAERREKLSA